MALVAICRAPRALARGAVEGVRIPLQDYLGRERPGLRGPNTEAVAEGSPAEPLQRGWETILLLEDEAVLRSLVHRILVGGGYTVLEQEAVESALSLAKLRSGPIHLVLTDIVMPGMSGPDFASRLFLARPETRVLYMSGYTADVIDAKIMPPGAHFIEKPFSPEKLLRKVREVLGSPPVHALSQ